MGDDAEPNDDPEPDDEPEPVWIKLVPRLEPLALPDPVTTLEPVAPEASFWLEPKAPDVTPPTPRTAPPTAELTGCVPELPAPLETGGVATAGVVTAGVVAVGRPPAAGVVTDGTVAGGTVTPGVGTEAV
ncbi:MAG TPA: hypothetical protein VG371_04020 [Solirubrobacteraceae bacterium]|nr:hypothetical protein [Solirubrobacteraceae bacterium]